MYQVDGANRRGSIVDKKESSDTGERKGRRDEGTGCQRFGFEELDTTIDAVVWFPKLRTES